MIKLDDISKEAASRIKEVCSKPRAKRVQLERLVSTGILSSAVIVEDEDGWCVKIEPDDQGGYNLFKQHSLGWNWDDSISDDSAMHRIRHGYRVYREY